MPSSGTQINRGIRLNVEGSDAVANLQRVGEAGEVNLRKVGDGARRASAELKQAGEEAGRFSGAARAQISNVSFQIQDFAVQVAGGTSALRAFSQQAPQLLGAFGPWGAILGTGAAVLGGLATTVLGFNDETAKTPDALAGAMKALADSGSQWDDLKKKIDAATGAQRDYLAQAAQADLATARKQLPGQVEAATSGYLGRIQTELGSLGQVQRQQSRDTPQRGPAFLQQLYKDSEAQNADLRKRAVDLAADGKIEELIQVLNSAGAPSDEERKARDALIATARTVNANLAAVEAAKVAAGKQAFAAGPGGGAPGAAPLTLPTLDVTASGGSGGTRAADATKAVLDGLARDALALTDARQAFIDSYLARDPTADADERAKIIAAAGSLFDQRALAEAHKEGDQRRQQAMQQLAADRERDQKVLDALTRGGLKFTDPRQAAQDAAVARLSDTGKQDEATVAQARKLAGINYDLAVAQQQAADASRIRVAVSKEMARMDQQAARSIDALGLSLGNQTEDLEKNRAEIERLYKLGYLSDKQRGLGMLLNDDNGFVRGGSRGVKELADEWTDLGKIVQQDVVGGVEAFSDKLTDAVLTGKASLEDLRATFLRTFVQQSINYGIGSLLQVGLGAVAGYYGGGAGAGAVTNAVTASSVSNSGFLVGPKHTGGVVGEQSSWRMVDPAIFAGARRYHTGGLVDGEVPIIARRGEYVQTAEERARSQQPVSLHVTVDARGSSDPAAIQAAARLGAIEGAKLALKQHTEGMRRSPGYRATQRV